MTNTMRLFIADDNQRAESRSSALVRAWPGPSVRTSFVPLQEPLHGSLQVARRRDCPQAKAYRRLRHRLFSLGDPHVIAVASAEAGEGKTTCALNLATVLSEETHCHVLLVEANTASPVLATIFRTRPPSDLADRLQRERASNEPWPVLTFEGVLAFHAAVMSPNHPPPHLDRWLFREFIEAVRKEYDYIVLDTPALSSGADANVAAQSCDGVVLAARAGKSRRKALQRVAQSLAPASIMGVVLLDSPETESSCA